MSKVTLHLVIEHSDHFGSGQIYTKPMTTDFLPRAGEMIVLFGGVMGTVARAYWEADGDVHAELERWVVDPAESMEYHVGRGSNPIRCWRTEQEHGDFVQLLTTNGWII